MEPVQFNESITLTKHEVFALLALLDDLSTLYELGYLFSEAADVEGFVRLLNDRLTRGRS